ncbi:MAG: cupin domain-containing protein [Candidatus Cloacimonetes bacterium]|nr:cupin domain-containing protein [Candidatus Cloacimonadota bacterium]
MKKINLLKIIKEIKETWEPRNVAFINGAALRIAKIEGAYNWHTHRNEDEFFLVLKGKVFIDTEDGSIELNEMEGYLVKKGTRHRSRTEKPAWILLIEPIRTKTKGE